MSILSKLKPEPIWIYFEEICNIPRLSRNEGQIRKYLLDFARKNGLESKEDEIGNILIIRPATPGMENRKTIVLQSHMDMVGEKNTDYQHDWAKDPIMPVMKGDELAAAVKARVPGQPVVMITAYAEMLKASNNPLTGVDGLISKPFLLENLREAIAKVAPMAMIPAKSAVMIRHFVIFICITSFEWNWHSLLCMTAAKR